MINGKHQEIGFMQGRLSPLVDGKIQAFPWDHWQDEFQFAYKHSFKIMEWTLDQKRLYENPFMTKEGQEEIRKLAHKYDISIPSLTGDCFMQAPFYKVKGNERDSLLQDLQNIIAEDSEEDNNVDEEFESALALNETDYYENVNFKENFNQGDIIEVFN